MKLFRRNRKKVETGSSDPGWRIFLEHGGTLCFELLTAQYTREIVIGRSADCAWSLDGVDNSASSRHAMLSKRKNHFYITDLGSRNGIYFQNRRIKEKKLALGDRISLGECTLIVEPAPRNARNVTRFHQLSYNNEKGRKTVVDITRPQTVIGSSKDCDIIFPDQLISSRHAELMLKNDGSCWIRDLNSRNGTSVNGDELSPDGERMLQDNDVITIAYVDLRFLDASVEHQDSRIRSAAVTLAVSILIVMGCYIGYMKLTPDSNALLKMANKEMKAGRLDTARKLIQEASYAENSDHTLYEREQLLRRITQWESIIRLWNSVKEDLGKRYYNQALRKVSSINHDDLNSWTWPGGALEKQKALVVKRLLDACSSSSATLRNTIASVEELENERRELALSIVDASRYQEPYLTQPVKDARPILARIDKTLAENKELQTTLALLDVAKPDYQAVLNGLEKISRESAGPVKARADKVLPAVQTLHRETLRVLTMVDKVCEMDFPAVDGFKLDLPETIDYSSEQNIGNLRKSLIDTVARFKDASLQLSLIYRNLVNRGVIAGRSLAVLDAFLNPENMKQVYAFDCLDMPLPKNSRTAPCGKYDEMLGIEFFYDYVSNLHSHTLTLNLEELPFKPTLYRCREVVGEIEKFIRYADKDENQWFNRGVFAEYLLHCRKLIAQRDRIVQEQLSRSAAPGSRQFLVSHGIAAYLLPDSAPRHAELNAQLEQSFRTFKREILKLNREYNIAMPEDALKIRSEIVRIGLPGDPILKKMWNQRPASGWEK